MAAGGHPMSSAASRRAPWSLSKRRLRWTTIFGRSRWHRSPAWCGSSDLELCRLETPGLEQYPVRDARLPNAMPRSRRVQQPDVVEPCAVTGSPGRQPRWAARGSTRCSGNVGRLLRHVGIRVGIAPRDVPKSLNRFEKGVNNVRIEVAAAALLDDGHGLFVGHS